MSVGSVQISLIASRRDGRGVAAEEFLQPLQIRPGEVEHVRADGDAWASGLVYFATINHSAFAGVGTSADTGAQSEAFATAVGEAFKTTSRFLDGRPPKITEEMRKAGLSLKLFVSIRMDLNQMELELPSDLLSSCGRHGLGIYVISNDIPASGILAAGTG